MATKGLGPDYRYIRNTQTWWKDKRIRLHDKVKSVLGVNKPKKITRHSLKPLNDKFGDMLEVKLCDKTENKTYWNKWGLFLKKSKKRKILKPYEFELVCYGTYVPDTIFNKWRNKDKLEEYVISFKLNKKDKNEIVVVPNLRENRPLWIYCNDGLRKSGRNYSNCEFLLKEINGTWMVILTNTKPLKFGKQILVKYGKRYWSKYNNRLK